MISRKIRRSFHLGQTNVADGFNHGVRNLWAESHVASQSQHHFFFFFSLGRITSWQTTSLPKPCLILKRCNCKTNFNGPRVKLMGAESSTTSPLSAVWKINVLKLLLVQVVFCLANRCSVVHYFNRATIKSLTFCVCSWYLALTKVTSSLNQGRKKSIKLH